MRRAGSGDIVCISGMRGGAPRVIYVDVALETGNNVNATSVVSFINGGARSKLFIKYKNKLPGMDLRYVFSEYVDFQMLAPPISSYSGILIRVSERICRC